MLGFLRRRHDGGRHALGAAVTGIPAGPRRVVVEPVPEPPPPPADPRRVELGFRDGSSTVLEPASEQARALLELADLLGRSDDAPGSSSTGLRPRQAR